MTQYARYRRRYRESWVQGYKMSDGCVSKTDNPTDDNYIALACAILCNLSSKRALQLMQLAPEPTGYDDAKYKNLGPVIYILNTICGLPRKKAAAIIGVDLSTANYALRYAGLYRDGRNRKQEV